MWRQGLSPWSSRPFGPRRRPVQPSTRTRRGICTISRGRYLGSATTPAGVRITQVGIEHVVGVFLDDLGVEYVRVSPLEHDGT